MTELEIVMRYTGWAKQVAQAAISQWKKHDPTWSANYILEYMRSENFKARPLDV